MKSERGVRVPNLQSDSGADGVRECRAAVAVDPAERARAATVGDNRPWAGGPGRPRPASAETIRRAWPTRIVGVATAELGFKRAKELVAGKVEMQKMEHDAQLQLESSRAMVREVEGQIELLKTYLDWTVIKALIDGVVLEKLVDPNELVVP